MDSRGLTLYKQARREVKVVAVSGHFSPLHLGHLSYLRAAKTLADFLLVIVNTDHQISQKGNIPFLDETSRLELVEAVRWVDWACLAVDTDRSVCRTLGVYRPDIFANGGDVDEGHCREVEVCRELGIEMVFGVGGSEKRYSSSGILEEVGKEWAKRNGFFQASQSTIRNS